MHWDVLREEEFTILWCSSDSSSLIYKVSVVREEAKGPLSDTTAVIANHKSGAD